MRACKVCVRRYVTKAILNKPHGYEEYRDCVCLGACIDHMSPHNFLFVITKLAAAHTDLDNSGDKLQTFKLSRVLHLSRGKLHQ